MNIKNKGKMYQKIKGIHYNFFHEIMYMINWNR
jgi:gamma-glutamylcysteine synthetase